MWLIMRPARLNQQQKGVTEAAGVPFSDTLMESGDGSTSSDIKSLTWHNLGLPEVSAAATDHERHGSETSPSSLVGAFALKRRRGEDDPRVGATTLILVKKVRQGSG
jgi:hypothetical protein